MKEDSKYIKKIEDLRKILSELVTLESNGSEKINGDESLENLLAKGKRIIAQNNVHEQWSLLDRNTNDTVTVLSKDNKIVYNSPNIFGYQPIQKIGKKAIDFIHPDDKKNAVKFWDDMLNNPEKTFSLEYRTIDDEDEWIESTGKCVKEVGQDNYCIINSRNITERKRLELRKERDLLQKTNINRLINASVDVKSLEELIEFTRIALIEYFGNEIPRVYLYDSRKNELSLHNQYFDNVLLKKLEKLTQIKLETIVPKVLKGGYFDKVIKGLKPIMLQEESDIIVAMKEHTDNKFLRSLAKTALDMMKIESYGLIPLLNKNKVAVIMAIQSSKKYSEEEIEDLNIIVNQINVILERYLVEQELKRSEEKFRQMTETIEEAFWLMDWETKKSLYISPGYERVYGRSFESLIESDTGRKDQIHPEDQKMVIDAFRTNAEDGTYDVEFRIIHPSNEIRWVHERAFPITDNGKVVRMAGYSADITERKIAQNKLTESEKQYRTLFERNLSGVYRATAEDVIIECNDSFAKIIGFKSKKEVVGKHARELYKNLNPEKFSDHLIENNNFLTGFESNLELNNGIKIWVLENASLIIDKNDNVPKFIEGTIIDITELKRAESEIEELAKFPEENPNPVIRVNDKDEVIYVNKVGKEIIEHIITKSKKLISEIRKVVDLAKNSNKTIEEEFLIDNKVFQFTVTPILEHKYVNLYGRDITERNRIDLMREISFIISKRASSKVLNITFLSQLIHEELKKIMDAKNLYLALYNPKNNTISFPYYKDKHNPKSVDSIYSNREFEDGIAEHVIVTRKPLLLVDEDITRFYNHKTTQKVVPKSWLGIPLENDGTVFGVLAVLSYTDSNAYGDQEVEFLSFVARQIGGLVDRAEATSTIIRHQDELIKEKKKLKHEHELALQYQSMLLSSQLNPHFIFNSLNSIQYFILDQNPEPALEYLSNFSTLMRSVLSNSAQQYISLESEIDFLRIYLDLELNRYMDKFKYQLKVNDNIDLTETLIPPMILQPFIENTVIHGIGNLVKGGKIDIEFKRIGDHIVCSIKDNGVGRDEASRLTILRKGNEHKSFSTEINNTRLEILNSLEQGGYSSEIIDRINKKGKPIGTIVKVKFPFITDI